MPQRYRKWVIRGLSLFGKMALEKRKQCNYLLYLAWLAASLTSYRTGTSAPCLHIKVVYWVILFSLKCLFKVISILLMKYHMCHPGVG